MAAGCAEEAGAVCCVCSVLCWQASERRASRLLFPRDFILRDDLCAKFASEMWGSRPVTHHRRGAEGVLQSHSAVVVETNEHQTRLVPRIRELELFYDDDVG